MKKKTNKTEQVLKYLNTHAGITSMQAIEKFGATRLSAIIFNLRKKGYVILTSDIEDIDRYGNKVIYARYSLVK